MTKDTTPPESRGYQRVLNEVSNLIEKARKNVARSVNSILTVTYWSVGKRIIVYEQEGETRAHYGKALLKRFSADLQNKFGRGFSERNLRQMRAFYLWQQKPQTMSAKLTDQTQPTELIECFPLPWSHYVRLLSVEPTQARRFYEAEALRGGWTVRQLDRQISTRFYERTLLSKNKAWMLEKALAPEPVNRSQPAGEIKDPYILEFLDLKNEYSESDLEEALIAKLEEFLLELGGEFTFVGRQRRLRIGDEWYRIDLLFYHRRLRCLVVIDLKLGKFTHADAGQMHMYLNYARRHWTLPGENPPVGIILCAQKNDTVVHYALDGLPNKIVTAEYLTALPKEGTLVEELERARKHLEKWNPQAKKSKR